LGAPMRGSETDKAYTLLLSRIACLGTFHHKEIGFTGPLSRHLLGYHQMISAVRGSLRDLVEVHALSMFMSGAVSREVEPIVYTTVGANLPFVEEPDLGLSLVVKSYLDEASNDPNKRSDIERWFNHAYDIKGDLKKAWMMWGAVSGLEDLTFRRTLLIFLPRSTLVSRLPTVPSSTTTPRTPSRMPMSGSLRSYSKSSPARRLSCIICTGLEVQHVVMAVLGTLRSASATTNNTSNQPLGVFVPERSFP